MQYFFLGNHRKFIFFYFFSNSDKGNNNSRRWMSQNRPDITYPTSFSPKGTSIMAFPSRQRTSSNSSSSSSEDPTHLPDNVQKYKDKINGLEKVSSQGGKPDGYVDPKKIIHRSSTTDTSGN